MLVTTGLSQSQPTDVQAENKHSQWEERGGRVQRGLAARSLPMLIVF